MDEEDESSSSSSSVILSAKKSIANIIAQNYSWKGHKYFGSMTMFFAESTYVLCEGKLRKNNGLFESADEFADFVSEYVTDYNGKVTVGEKGEDFKPCYTKEHGFKLWDFYHNEVIQINNRCHPGPGIYHGQKRDYTLKGLLKK